jgi:hypothetical protein
LAPVYIFEEIGWKLDTGRKGEQAQEGKGDERGKFLERGKTCGNVHALLKKQTDGK